MVASVMNVENISKDDIKNIWKDKQWQNEQQNKQRINQKKKQH